MRLSFPNGDHPDVLVHEGSVHLGAGVDNDIHLPDLRERHARLTRDARGIVLEILDNCARAHVNARPVREKAFVRLGDTLCLDAVTIAVCDMDEQAVPAEPAARPARRQGMPRGVLRGMAGSWFGKSVAIGAQLHVGIDASGAVQLSEHPLMDECARIQVEPGRIELRSSEAGGSLVNGIRRERSRLRSGDQLRFGRERFVVECNGTAVPPVEIAETEPDATPQPAQGSAEDDAGTSGTAIGWLIAAAAIIGALLAWVLAIGA